MVSPDLVNRAIEQIRKRKGNYQYFFKNLTSPTWIRPLWDKGMFAEPLMLVKQEGMLSFPFWPESEYLARMASLDPETVTEVILKIPETDNERIHQDYVDAALNMPADFTAKIAAMEIKWVKEKQYLYLLLPEKLGQLSTKLVEDGYIVLAVSLMEELLQPSNTSERATIGTLGEIRGKIDEWQYEKLVKERIPILVNRAGVMALENLCFLLDKGLKQLGYGQDIDEYTGVIDDYSWIWRPAIEEHKQNKPYGAIEDFLVIAVRDAAQQLIAKNGLSCSEVVQIFEEYDWALFHRLTLYILRLFPNNENELLKSKIVNEMYFYDYKFKYEYSMLLKDCFHLLDSEDQNIILGWIETGLNADEVRGRIVATEMPGEEEINRYNDIWRRDKLAVFHNSLPEHLKTLYDSLVSKYGEAKHPEFSFYTSSISYGTRSPYTSEEIDAMSIEYLVHMLSTWDTTDEGVSSKEGLGKELSLVVQLNPQKYAEVANLFIGHESIYVRDILSAFNQCIKDGKAFDWDQIILLCNWVLQQEDNSLPGKDGYSGKDTDWKWTRRTIAELMISGLETSGAMIPIKFRTQVWDIISVLLTDPDPGKDKDRTDDDNFEPYIYGLNSTRGRALQSVINYAIWITEDNKSDSKSQQGFESLPEVREALEQHLKDPSIAVRSVYGKLLPWIVSLDKNWVEISIDDIFPDDPQLNDYFLSAWTTYILYGFPYNYVLETTLPIYRRAVKMLAQPCNWRNYSTYEKHLVDHLFVFYLRGRIEIESHDRLLELFYENASPGLAGHVFKSIGMAIRDGDDAVRSQEILQRIQLLVDYRVDKVSSLESAENVYQELVTFGWIFSSGLFDDRWALRTLLKILDFAKSIEPAHLVVERLAETMNLFPAESLAALKLIINNSNKSYHIYGYQDSIEKILRIAMLNENIESGKSAEEIINLLGVKGFYRFRELL